MPHPDEGRLLASRYQLETLIAERADGTALWRAWGVMSERHVVVARLGATESAAERSARAARRLGELHHPHVAAVLEHGDDGGAYLVYDLIDGETATDTLARRRFPLPEVLALGDQILWALEHAHARGIVHGAITADGIFLARRGHGAASAQLIDFGRSTRGDVTEADDLHAVARTLYQVTAGIAPSAEPPPLMSLLADEPNLARWDAFLHRALTTAPFRDATAMRAALGEIAQHLRRARAGREARAVVTTAPSMKRAMHEVADFQTTEATAVPASAGAATDTSSGEDAAVAAAQLGTDQSSAPPVPTAAPRAQPPAPPAPPHASAPEGPRRPTMPMGSRPDLATEAPLSAVAASSLAPRRGFPWLIAGAFGVLAGLAVAIIVATLDHPRPVAPGKTPGVTSVAPTSPRPGEPPVAGEAAPPPAAGPGAAETAAAEIGTTRVVVESEPSGALVASAGAILGKTPLPLDVPAGEHRFDVSLPGYQAQSLVVDVRGADEIHSRIRLEPLVTTKSP